MSTELDLLNRKLTLALENKVWLRDRMDELRQKYPDEYVAVDQGEVVGHHKDLRKLLRNLQKHFGKNVDRVAIDFVSSKKIELILYLI